MPARSITRITKTVVDRLQPGDTIWDSEVKGFGIRCQHAARTYLLKTKVSGKARWITIGKHGSPWTAEKARVEALRLLGSIADGVDPRKVELADQITVADLCERYMAQHAIPTKKPSSAALDRKNIDNHVIPLLGQKLAREVSSTEIEGFKDAVKTGKTAPKDRKAKSQSQGGGLTVRGGPGVCNRCLTLLSKMFKLAEIWGIRPKASNPVEGVSRYRETPKERFLSVNEIGQLGEILDEFDRHGIDSPYPTAAIRLLMLTGARLSEIIKLRWDQVHVDRGLIRLSDSKTGAKTIYLPSQAIAILTSLPQLSDNPYVIIGGKAGKHLVDLQRPWQRIRVKANLADVRIHDLRHTFASLAAQGGKSLSEIGELLGHRSTETTKRYAHFTESHIANASNEVGAMVASALRSK
jgi:integrase